MKCRDCGTELINKQGVNYCPKCMKKRFIQPREIDPRTGEWEGITHGN